MQVLARGLEFPEGPVAQSDGSILLVEVRGGWLTRVSPGGDVERLVHLGGGPNGAALGPDGALYVCNNGGNVWIDAGGLWLPAGPPPDYTSGSIQRVDLQRGTVTTLYTHCDDEPLAGPNDIVFDSSGHFWFTDMGKEFGTSRRTGAVYYANIDGSELIRAIPHVQSPNGIALSPAEDILYFSDTYSGRVYFRRVTRPGVLAPAESPVFPGSLAFVPPGLQALDSMAIQQDGAVCVATIGVGAISIGHRGSTPTSIPVPDPFPTNICFGGSDMRTAWVTGVATGTLYQTTWAQPGHKLVY